MLNVTLFVAYLACVPAANWLVGHVGTVCVSNGPCLVPVAPGMLAPSGVMLAGLALVLRDLVQRALGLRWSLLAVGLGTVLSAAIAPPALVLASSIAFLLSEVTDALLFTPLLRRGLMLAVFASSMVGLVVDSIVFLGLAFGSLDHLAGQVVGKAEMVLIATMVVALLRPNAQRAAT